MSGSSLFCGVDVGTSACKTVLLDDRGTIVCTAARSYPTRRTPQGEVTQAPKDWLAAVAATVRRCAQEAGPRRVAAIGITAPAHAVVLLGTEGTPLYRSLLAFDGRPDKVAGELRASMGPSFFETTFVELTAGWSFAQLAWLRGQLGAETWRRITHVLPQKDYVRFAMTGIVATDPSDAAGTAMMDQRSGAWSPGLCREVGLSPEQLPPIWPATRSAGGLSSSWSRRTGLTSGTPVVVGATDTVTELLSVGAKEPGASIAKIASTGTIVTVTAEPRPHRALLTYPHATPGMWYSAAATSTAATAYNWVSNLVAGSPPSGRPRSYQQYDAAVRRLPPGSEGLLFLPYLNGERVPHWDLRLRGAFLGLASGHRQEHLLRAAMEGVALSLRDCLEQMHAAGIAVHSPSFTGGGAMSPLWRRILASALGMPGNLVRPQGPAVGAAMLARSGVFGGMPGARVRRVPVVPPAGWVASYGKLYGIYTEAARSITDVSHELTDLARSEQA